MKEKFRNLVNWFKEHKAAAGVFVAALVLLIYYKFFRGGSEPQAAGMMYSPNPGDGGGGGGSTDAVAGAIGQMMESQNKFMENQKSFMEAQVEGQVSFMKNLSDQMNELLTQTTEAFSNMSQQNAIPFQTGLASQYDEGNWRDFGGNIINQAKDGSWVSSNGMSGKTVTFTDAATNRKVTTGQDSYIQSQLSRLEKINKTGVDPYGHGETAANIKKDLAKYGY